VNALQAALRFQGAPPGGEATAPRPQAVASAAARLKHEAAALPAPFSGDWPVARSRMRHALDRHAWDEVRAEDWLAALPRLGEEAAPFFRQTRWQIRFRQFFEGHRSSVPLKHLIRRYLAQFTEDPEVTEWTGSLIRRQLSQQRHPVLEFWREVDARCKCFTPGAGPSRLAAACIQAAEPEQLLCLSGFGPEARGWQFVEAAYHWMLYQWLERPPARWELGATRALAAWGWDAAEARPRYPAAATDYRRFLTLTTAAWQSDASLGPALQRWLA